MKIFFLQLVFLLLTGFNAGEMNSNFPQDNLIIGNETLLRDNAGLIINKRIGLITNSSGVTTNGNSFLDLLNKSYRITKVFTPEHGLRGNDVNENYTDAITGIPVVTLYGSKKKPDAADVSDIDVLVYDIQDVGARFYTFINTMFYCMETAAENNIPFVVCDRPIMLGGNYIDGFLLDRDESSFVGMIDVPITYAMTCGELAGYINSKYLDGRCNLTVSKMKNYTHSSTYKEFNLPWIKPSPNIYFQSSAVCYPGTCLLEGTNFSEGRGSEKPFEYVGASYCDGKILADAMSDYMIPGVKFEPIQFTPQSNSNAMSPKFENQNCEGIYINVTDDNVFQPVKAGIALLVSLKKLFPEFKINKNNFIDKLAGTKRLRQMIENGNSYEEIIQSYADELEQFKTERTKFLLYE